jgi:succinylarginine dihydrolase
MLFAGGLAVRSLGLEFLPKLEEGNFWIRATLPQSISLEDSDGYVNRMRAGHEELSGSRDRGVAARPAGRRHRRDRILQRRILRAAEAVRHLAGKGVDKEKLTET